MLNNKIAEMLNDQINKELYSAYLYLDFANYYADEGLDLINNGHRVTFAAVAKPDKTFKTHLDPLTAGYAHEQYVTSLITDIYHEAAGQKDYRTMQFLDWFIKEQGEEETNADDMIKKYKLFASDAKGLYALNQELLGRVYAPSTTGPAM